MLSGEEVVLLSFAFNRFESLERLVEATIILQHKEQRAAGLTSKPTPQIFFSPIKLVALPGLTNNLLHKMQTVSSVDMAARRVLN